CSALRATARLPLQFEKTLALALRSLELRNVFERADVADLPACNVHGRGAPAYPHNASVGMQESVRFGPRLGHHPGATPRVRNPLSIVRVQRSRPAAGSRLFEARAMKHLAHGVVEDRFAVHVHDGDAQWRRFDERAKPGFALAQLLGAFELRRDVCADAEPLLDRAALVAYREGA